MSSEQGLPHRLADGHTGCVSTSTRRDQHKSEYAARLHFLAETSATLDAEDIATSIPFDDMWWVEIVLPANFFLEHGCMFVQKDENEGADMQRARAWRNWKRLYAFQLRLRRMQDVTPLRELPGLKDSKYLYQKICDERSRVARAYIEACDCLPRQIVSREEQSYEVRDPSNESNFQKHFRKEKAKWLKRHLVSTLTIG